MSFDGSEDIEYGHGILDPVQKPGKVKGDAKSLRPVNFLPVLRKILSLITIDRLKIEAPSYISQSQTSYHHERSRTDAVWGLESRFARVQKYDETI